MAAIYRRELKGYFNTMIGYVIIVFLLAFSGIYFMAYNLNYGYPYFSYVLSGGIGGFVLGKWKKRQKFLWGLLVGILYVATLLGAALWIQKGSLPPIPYMGTASAICIGSAMLGGMLS